MRLRVQPRRVGRAFGLIMALLGVCAGAQVTSRDWRLRPEGIGAAADALRLPDRASAPQKSQGWQFLSAPLTVKGERGALAVSDGSYWHFELRALVKRDAKAALRVGLIFSYQDEGSYGALLWESGTGTLTLRMLRQNHATDIAKGKASFGSRPWASVVLRVVMGDIVCYVNGEKVLTGSAPSLLGRVAVFAVGGDAVMLDGVEARPLDAKEADADIFRRGRSEFEGKCAACHELNGPWNTNYAPDDWASVVDQMLFVEGADEEISRAEANRILDYLRLISLHADRNRYPPGGASGRRAERYQQKGVREAEKRPECRHWGDRSRQNPIS